MHTRRSYSTRDTYLFRDNNVKLLIKAFKSINLRFEKLDITYMTSLIAAYFFSIELMSQGYGLF